ncbi:uncharacterized protein LOC129586635 isoform X2 [Paramacrobiotus metropolitanus]|nr:uncharacterized protein LOC129586635 isoform X2 [Paramacrobiotus metropolitanus]
MLWKFAFFCLVSINKFVAPQCSPAFPASVKGIGGETPKQADGIWYVYRKMGGNYTSTAQIQITSVAPFADPVISQPSTLQWWEIFPDSSDTPCTHQFFTGTYSNAGQVIGDLGGSDDNYIMRPTDFVVLYHDYQNLSISYGCSRSQTDNGHCATPTIIVQTRKRPDQLSATEAQNFDTIINSAFLQYCVTVQNIPKEIYGPKGTCGMIDPPACVAQDIQGMMLTIVNSTVSSTTSVSFNYDTSTISNFTPSSCKWPNAIPSPGKVDFNLIQGQYYYYRRLFSPEIDPVNQQAVLHFVGASASPLINASTNTYWAEYSNYDSKNSSKCVYGFFVGKIQTAGSCRA